MGQVACFKTANAADERKDSEETEADMIAPMIKSHQSRRIGCGAYKNECQDTILIIDDLGEDAYFYAVFDGFGPKGKEVGEYIRDSIQGELENRKKVLRFSTPQREIEKGLKEVIKAVDGKLKTSKIDISESGSCMLGALILKNMCCIINIGNSQAAKCRGDAEKSDINEISKQHSLLNMNERTRVEKAGARIDRITTATGQKLGVDRIWIDEKGPGIVTTRAFGATKYKKILSIEPEITFSSLGPPDKFLIIASDGLWDIMKFEDISSNYWANEADADKNLAEMIIKDAGKKWDMLAKRPKEFHFGIGDDPRMIAASDDLGVILLQLQFPSRSGKEN